MIVTRHPETGRLVPLSKSGFFEALASLPERQKRRMRVGLALSYGLLDLAAKYMCEKIETIN